MILALHLNDEEIAARRGLPGAVKRVRRAVNNVMYPGDACWYAYDAMGRRREGRLWQARNKKKIEWKHLRNCANYVGVGVLDALALYNKAFARRRRICSHCDERQNERDKSNFKRL